MEVLQNRKMYLLRLTSLLVFSCSIVFAQTAKPAPAQSPTNLIAELQKLLSAEVAAHPSLPGELMHVQASKQGINVSLAAGAFDRYFISFLRGVACGNYRCQVFGKRHPLASVILRKMRPIDWFCHMPLVYTRLG